MKVIQVGDIAVEKNLPGITGLSGLPYDFLGLFLSFFLFRSYHLNSAREGCF